MHLDLSGTGGKVETLHTSLPKVYTVNPFAREGNLLHFLRMHHTQGESS